jgi:hypothetical protein
MDTSDEFSLSKRIYVEPVGHTRFARGDSHQEREVAEETVFVDETARGAFMARHEHLLEHYLHSLSAGRSISLVVKVNVVL